MLSGINWRPSYCLGVAPGRTDLSWKIGKICLVLCWAGCRLAVAQWGKVIELTSWPSFFSCKHDRTSGKKRQGQGNLTRWQLFMVVSQLIAEGNIFQSCILLSRLSVLQFCLTTRISSGLPDREITLQGPWLEHLILEWKFKKKSS